MNRETVGKIILVHRENSIAAYLGWCTTFDSYCEAHEAGSCDCCRWKRLIYATMQQERVVAWSSHRRYPRVARTKGSRSTFCPKNGLEKASSGNTHRVKVIGKYLSMMSYRTYSTTA